MKTLTQQRPLTEPPLKRGLVHPIASLLAIGLLSGCPDPSAVDASDDEATTSTGETTGGSSSSDGTSTGQATDASSDSGATSSPVGSTSGNDSTTGDPEASTGDVSTETGSEETGSEGTGSGETGSEETGSTSDSETDSGSTSTGDETTGCVETDWYPDADGDGFGDAAGVVSACEAPEDHVDNADDCDDTTELRNPDQLEICDGLDNDCDDALDEWSTLNPTCGGCEMQLQGGSVYAYCLGGVNFEDAEAACVAQGTSLARIESQLENNLITQTAAQVADGDYSIGLMLDADTWAWTDGTALTFDAWRPGAPDSGDDCAELDTLDAGLWNDIPCTASNSTVGWICEGTP